ncbi:MAG: hypothetical protein JWP92_3744 [Caulobacter sp.]|nr:hypothetical protein [Caulobacter sp.]
MSKTLRAAGTIIAGVALVATGVGALAGVGLLGASASALAASAGAWTLAGISVQTIGAVGAGLAFLGDATAKPLKIGGVAGSQVDFAADPNAPIPYLVGRSGTGGRIIYATTGEAKNRNILYNTVLSGGGPIGGFDSFKAADETVTFSPLTEAATGGAYNLRMWQRRQLGATPSAALMPPNTTDFAVLSEWTPAHKLSGYATSWYVLGYDQKTYPSGVPKAVWTIRGALVYDPRADDDYPGGIGGQRANDPSTWQWSENPWLHALAWSRGRYANGVRVLGIGAPMAALDVAAAVEGANVSDANGWKVGGVVYSNDSKWDVLKAMCQAGGGRPVQLGASISFLVNTPRVSLATLTAADLSGGYSVQAAQSVRGRPNQIIPRYRSEDHGWEMVAAGPVKVPAYVTADKRLRSREVEYPLVQDAEQVAQLAAYDLVNAREFGPVTIRCKPAWMGFKGGDCITVDVADLAMSGQKAMILTRTVDPMTGDVSLTLQSETDGKHDFALGRTASPPPIPGLSSSDPLPVAPAIGSWTAVGGVLASADGATIPAIIITGAVDDPNATHLIVEYRQVLAGPTYGPWVGNEYPSSSTRIEIVGLISGATYQVRVRYRTIRGLEDTEVFLDLGSVTVGKIVADNALRLGDVVAAEVLASVQAAQDAADAGLADARNALIRIEAARAEGAALQNNLLHELTPPSGRPTGATIDDQIRIVEDAKQTIVEHYTEQTVGFANAAAALSTESLTRATQDSALALYQINLAAVVDANYATAQTQLATLTTNLSATSSALTTLTTNFNSNVSSVSSQLSSISSAQSSQASSITSLFATTGSHTSSISITASALATLNGQVASAYGVDLSTDVLGNRVVVGFKGINNGVTGGWIFSGSYFGISTGFSGVKYPFFVSGGTVYLTDTVIDGNLLITGSVTRGKVPLGEFSDGSSVTDGSVQAIGGSDVTCATLAVYCYGGDLDITNSLAMQNFGADCQVTGTIYFDGVQIDTWDSIYRGSFAERLPQVTPPRTPSVGWHTIELRVRQTGSISINKILGTIIAVNRIR